MTRVIYSARAERDLIEIATHIAQSNEAVAFQWLERARAKCRAVAGQPRIGRRRPQFRGGDIRSYAFGNYLIFYRTSRDGIEVVRIMHGARRITDLMD